MSSSEASQERRGSLPDSLSSGREEDEGLRPAEELRKGTPQWLHPRADASPMPWGASSVHSDRSSIISMTNERRRRTSVLSNPDSLHDFARVLTADKTHRRRSSAEAPLRTIHPSLSTSSLTSPRSMHTPLSPRTSHSRVSFDNPRQPSPPALESARVPPQTPRFGSVSTAGNGLEAWEEGDSFDEHGTPQPPKQSSASRFAQASREASAATSLRAASAPPSPDDKLRSHIGIVGLGEGWAGGPQRDVRGKKLKASKLAASDPLALWAEQPVAGPSNRGLASYSVRSFWGRSMQNLGFAKSTASLHETHMEAWSAEPEKQITPGDKARRMLKRMSLQGRTASVEAKDRRRQSLAVFDFSQVPEDQGPSRRSRIPPSPSVPSFAPSEQSSRSSRRSRRPFSPFSPADLPIPARQSSLATLGSTHPFLQPAMRVDNIPGGLPPPRRPRNVSPLKTTVESPPASTSTLRPDSRLSSLPSPPANPNRQSHRRSKTFGVADIASEIADDDARAAAILDAQPTYVPLAPSLDTPITPTAPPPIKRRRSMLNRLKGRASSSSSISSGLDAPSGPTEPSTPRTISQASSRRKEATADAKPTSVWKRLPSFSRQPKQAPSNETTPKAQSKSVFGGLRSPSMLRLSSPRKASQPSNDAPPPDATDYRVVQSVVEEMLSLPSTSQSSASELTPATSVESLKATLEGFLGAHRLSRLSEMDDELDGDDYHLGRKGQSPYALDVDLGGKGLNLPAMLASCDDLSAKLDADAARSRSHLRGASTSVTQVSAVRSASHTRHQSMPVDLAEICKATSSADDLSSIGTIQLAFPLPPIESPPSPDVDQLEHLVTPHEPSARLSLQQAVEQVPGRKLSHASERKLSVGHARLNIHRASDAGSAFSMSSTDCSELEFAEPQRAQIRPAKLSPPLEGIHRQAFFLHTSPPLHATRA